MQHDAADQLDIEVAHVQDAPAGFAANGEGFDQQVVESGSPLAMRCLKSTVFCGQFGVGELLQRGLEIVDRGDKRTDTLDFAVMFRAKYLGECTVEHGSRGYYQCNWRRGVGEWRMTIGVESSRRINAANYVLDQQRSWRSSLTGAAHDSRTRYRGINL